MKQITNLPGVQAELQKYIIWNHSNRNHWEKCFVGTLEECEKEYSEMEYGEPNESIHQNEITDQRENNVEGIGYATFASGETIFYSFKPLN